MVLNMNHVTTLQSDLLVAADEIERRERCTPRPLFRSHQVRGSRKPTTQALATLDVAGLREAADLKRAAFLQVAICRRAVERLDDPTLTEVERGALNFQLRQGIAFVDRLTEISRGDAAPTQTP